jgi:hypothetical protein
MNWLADATAVMSRPVIFTLSPGLTTVRLPLLNVSYAERNCAETIRSFGFGLP